MYGGGGGRQGFHNQVNVFKNDNDSEEGVNINCIYYTIFFEVPCPSLLANPVSL